MDPVSEALNISDIAGKFFDEEAGYDALDELEKDSKVRGGMNIKIPLETWERVFENLILGYIAREDYDKVVSTMASYENRAFDKKVTVNFGGHERKIFPNVLFTKYNDVFDDIYFNKPKLFLAFERFTDEVKNGLNNVVAKKATIILGRLLASATFPYSQDVINRIQFLVSAMEGGIKLLSNVRILTEILANGPDFDERRADYFFAVLYPSLIERNKELIKFQKAMKSDYDKKHQRRMFKDIRTGTVLDAFHPKFVYSFLWNQERGEKFLFGRQQDILTYDKEEFVWENFLKFGIRNNILFRDLDLLHDYLKESSPIHTIDFFILLFRGINRVYLNRIFSREDFVELAFTQPIIVTGIVKSEYILKNVSEKGLNLIKAHAASYNGPFEHFYGLIYRAKKLGFNTDNYRDEYKISPVSEDITKTREIQKLLKDFDKTGEINQGQLSVAFGGRRGYVVKHEGDIYSTRSIDMDMISEPRSKNANPDLEIADYSNKEFLNTKPKNLKFYRTRYSYRGKMFDERMDANEERKSDMHHNSRDLSRKNYREYRLKFKHVMEGYKWKPKTDEENESSSDSSSSSSSSSDDDSKPEKKTIGGLLNGSPVNRLPLGGGRPVNRLPLGGGRPVGGGRPLGGRPVNRLPLGGGRPVGAPSPRKITVDRSSSSESSESSSDDVPKGRGRPAGAPRPRKIIVERSSSSSEDSESSSEELPRKKTRGRPAGAPFPRRKMASSSSEENSESSSEEVPRKKTVGRPAGSPTKMRPPTKMTSSSSSSTEETSSDSPKRKPMSLKERLQAAKDRKAKTNDDAEKYFGYSVRKPAYSSSEEESD